jgi:glyoxylase-like metal-dependent hydrolase (beta-lactamase superfamily II)
MYKPMQIDSLTLGIFQSNTYFLTEAGETLIIDPGDRGQKILDFIREKELNPVGIVCTHAHLDHIISAPLIMKEYAIPCFLHEKEQEVLKYLRTMCEKFHMPYHGEPEPVTWLDGRKLLKAGHFNLSYRHTPGHTPGGIILVTDFGVFTGDTIFYHSVGRTDFPGGDHEALMASIRDQIFTLPGKTILYPGHGPATSVNHEKQHNPFTAGL